MNKSSAQQQGPLWSHGWVNWEINAELWQSMKFMQGVGKRKYKAEYAKLKSHHTVNERRKEKNVVKLHRFVLLAGS